MDSRIRSLDGLRGIALVAVAVFHAWPEVLGGGFLGVEMFFVLSGFLLTSLLLDEHERTGAIDKRAYAARRLRRIAPGMVALLVALTLMSPFLLDDLHRLGGDIASSLFGVTNWHLIAQDSSYFAQFGRPSLVRHLWSIAIELQAYVVVPFVVAFCARRRQRTAVAVLAAATLLSATLMAVLYTAPDAARVYYGTDTRIGAIATGALLAVLMRRRRPAYAPRITARAVGLLGLTAATALGALFVLADPQSRLLYPAGFLGTQAATAALLFVGTRPGRGSAILATPALRWLGTRSYGIYLWHWPLVVLVESRWVSLAAALVLGELSYRFVEQRFLRPRKAAEPSVAELDAAETSRRRGEPETLQLVGRMLQAATLGLALIILASLVVQPPTDPVEASITGGERVLAARPSPIPTPKPTPRPAPAPAPEPAPEPFRGTAVGDSVMLGAVRQLIDYLGPELRIDAEKSRQIADAAGVIQALADDGGLGSVLFVHLGNNGPIRPGHIEAIVAGSGKAPVLLVTVRVSKPWQDANNQVIRAAAESYKNVHLVDWFAKSEGHRHWFHFDGTHMTASGASTYAAFLAESLPKPPEPTPTPTPDKISPSIEV